MKTTVFMTGLLALTILAPAANALTIENTDKAPYTLKWTPKGGKAADLEVKASAKADIDCKAGCVLSLGGKDTTVDGKLVKIMIKGGKLVQ